MYYVFEYKEEDHVQPLKDEKEARQMLRVTYKAGSDTIPLGYMDKHKVIHVFEPYVVESGISPLELVERIAIAINSYLVSRAARLE